MRLKRIGYWKTDQESSWPDPVAFVDPAWDPSDRTIVEDYLERGLVARTYMGKARCQICQEQVGSLELSDGTYIWPEGLRHYVGVHNVRLPEQFVDHARRWIAELQAAEVEDEWWMNLS